MNWIRSHFVEPLLSLAYGRTSNRAETDRDGEAPRRRGLVLVADGVGSLDLCGVGIRYAVAAERLPYTVEVFHWGHGFGRWYADLTDVANRDAKARLMVEKVRRYRVERPRDPVFLVSKSGGAGVVVQALERLEEGDVECAVLLAPALSPAYDLSRALRAIRREIVVFWSPLDVFVLGAGTRLFGTVDRVKSVGAGLVGFLSPNADGQDHERGRQYLKLRQVRWHPGMMSSGYLGGHVGPDSPWFLRRYVVPLLRAEATDDF